jgi:glycosyltransferase involved in cell wall biosynthesis
MAIVEAFAFGVAVISSPVGAIPELVVDRETGLLVTAGDVPALGRAIETLCVDGELRDRLARAGRTVWENHLGIANYTTRIAAIWVAIASRSNLPPGERVRLQ